MKSALGAAARRPFGIAYLIVLLAFLLNTAINGPEHTADLVSSVSFALKSLLPSNPNATIQEGREGFFSATLRYPAELVSLFRDAERDGIEALADFATLEKRWKALSDKPLRTVFINPELIEPLTNKKALASARPPVLIDEGSFKSMLPWLRDIRAAALAGDGKGITRSGVPFEPAQP